MLPEEQEGQAGIPEGTQEAPTTPEAQQSVPVAEASTPGEPEVPEGVDVEAYRAAQRVFTPKQQRLASELAEEKRRREEVERQLATFQALQTDLAEVKARIAPPQAPPAPPEEAPDPLLDPAGYTRFVVRNEVKPILDKQAATEAELDRQRKLGKWATDGARLRAANPALNNPTSVEAQAVNEFLATSKNQRVIDAYENGVLTIEQVYVLAMGNRQPRIAEQKVVADLVRKANAQVSMPGVSGEGKKKSQTMDSFIGDLWDTLDREERKKQ